MYVHEKTGDRLEVLTLDRKAPAAAAVRYEKHNEHSTDHHNYSIFSGPPTKKNEAAWRHLIERRFPLPLKYELLCTHVCQSYLLRFYL